MDKRQKQAFKKEFKNVLKKFVEQLRTYVSTDNGEWAIKGFIDVYKNIYTISSDTKIVSKILENSFVP